MGRKLLTAVVIALGVALAWRWLAVEYLPGRLWASALRAEQAGRWDEALDRYERFFTRYPEDPRLRGPMLRRVLGCLRQGPPLEQPHWADTAELYLMFHRGGFEEGERRMRSRALPILLRTPEGEREPLALAFEFRRSRFAQRTAVAASGRP